MESSHHTSSQNNFQETISDNECETEIINTIDYSLSFNQEDESHECEVGTTVDYHSQLRSWALETKSSHHSVTKLLKILNPIIPQLPLDSRTLLKTPRTVVLKKLDNGEYCHFGIENVLKQVIFSS